MLFKPRFEAIVKSSCGLLVVAIFGAIFVVVFVVSCASGSGSVNGSGSSAALSALPPELQSVDELLQGCEDRSDSDGAFVARCSDDLVLRVRTLADGDDTSAAAYRRDAVELANANAGRLLWDEIAVKASGQNITLDRGQVLAAADDGIVFVLLGAAQKSADGKEGKEFSCQERPADPQRCLQILTLLLSRPPTQAPKPQAVATTSSTFIHQTSVSLPPSCSVVHEAETHGHFGCAEDTALFWMVTPDMKDAVIEVENAMMLLAGDDGNELVPCLLLNAEARCEKSAEALIGLSYDKGVPLVVVCRAPDPVNHTLCQAVFRRP